MPFRVETATDIAACALTVPIQDEIWSGDVAVPPQLMLAIVHNGGFVALGYVDGDERPAAKSMSSTCVAMNSICLPLQWAKSGTAFSLATRGSAMPSASRSPRPRVPRCGAAS